MGSAYDAPNAIVRRDQSFLTVAGAAAVGARSMSGQKRILRAIHMEVITAGTAGTNNLVVSVAQNGSSTTAVTTVALTTNSIGYNTTIGGLSTVVPALAKLTTTNGADATGVAVVTYEWDVAHDAVQS